MSDKLDMQIGIDYDDAGEREALQGLGRLQNMAKRDLAAEITRLNKARKEAAKLGDVDAYKKLDAQLKTAKKSLRELTQQSQIAKIATVQQAQAGMQFASTLGSLASGMKNGTASTADLANGVMSLGMAIKAGLGPIGLVMAAVQGLIMAWDAYKNKQEEAANQEIEEINKRVAAAERLRSVGKAIGEYHAAILGARLEKQKTALSKLHADEQREAKASLDMARQKADAANEIAESQRAEEEAQLRAKIARGEATEKELTAMLRRHARERQEETAAAASDRIAQDTNALDAQIEATKERIEQINAQRREAQETFKDVWRKADASKIEEEEARIAALKARYEEYEKQLKEQKEQHKKNFAWISRNVTSLINPELKQQINDSQDVIKDTRDKLKKAGQELVAAQNRYKQIFNNSQADVGRAKEAAQLKDNLKKELEEENAKLKDLQAEREVVSENLALTEDINEAKQKQLTAEQAAAKAREEQEKRQKDYAKLEGEAVGKKLAYVQRVLAALKEGSEEYERWAKEARKLSNASAKEQLKDIADKFKTSGSYAEESAKTEAQALAADKRALFARRAALQKLLATPDLDASTQKEINDALVETNKEIRGFQDAMKQGAQQAQRELTHFKLPDLTPTSKSLQGNLKRTATGMQMQAKRLEAAARKGDTKAMEQITRSMQRQASVLEAGTGYTQQYVALLEQAVANAQKILESGDSRTEDQKNKDAVRQKTQANIRFAKALDKGAAAAEKEAKGSTKKKSRDGEKQLDDANKKQAKEINKQTRQGKRDSKKNSPKGPMQAPGSGDAAALQANAAALQTQIDSLNQLLSAATAQLAQMAPALAQLAPLITQMGSLVAQGNAATAAALAAARQEIARIRESLNRIRNR